MESHSSPASPGEFYFLEFSAQMKEMDRFDDTIDEILEHSALPAEARLLVVTSPSGTGKTSWCLELSRRAKASGLAVGGLVSPAVFEHGEKIGIDLLDLASGELKRLASPRQGRSAMYSGRHWHLDPQVLAWGNGILARLEGCRLLILDELGALELCENQGLTNGLDLLASRNYTQACVVIRPSLLTNALERWPWAQVFQTVGLQQP